MQRTLLALITLLIAAATGCAREGTDGPAPPLDSPAGPAAETAALARGDASGRLEKLKRDIRRVAQENRCRRDNLPEVRAELQPLVDELLALAPPAPEADKKALVVGAWENLWSDLAYSPDVEATIDCKNIYQVVSPNGFYWNVSRQERPEGPVTSFLRGAYADAGDRLRIRFGQTIFTPGWLGESEDLIALASLAEAGFIEGVTLPPLGIEGDLQNAYVDDELRIIIGGIDAIAPRKNLFVLKRSPSRFDGGRPSP
ncbi:MAG TPA: hypothetical protein VFS43_20180 [Polyangiaceae bacterium]|nr:hypothetical protein [Polyangiaceae bacterium]